MKKETTEKIGFVEKIGKKKLIIICSVIGAVLIAAAGIGIYFAVRGPKNIEIERNESYTQLEQKEDLALNEVEASLEGYTKEEDGAFTVFTKGNESVKVKVNDKGEITYMSYNMELDDSVQSKIDDFSEDSIKYGDKESDVLKLLSDYNYIYNLKAETKDGHQIHIYHYGWTSQNAMLELNFTDGVLVYYTINSSSIAAKSNAPDVDDLQ